LLHLLVLLVMLVLGHKLLLLHTLLPSVATAASFYLS
jgi:hypothetical protein